MANCTRVKSFAFWKVNGKIYSFRVPVYKGVPLPWMKWYTSFNDDCRPTVLGWTVSLCEKWMVKYTTSGFPFIRGFLSHEWNDTRLLTMIGGQVYDGKKFRFLKSEWYIYNFRVPVSKGFSLPWRKWHTSFNDDWWPTVRGWKNSLSQTVPCKNNRHFQGLVTFSKIVFQYKYWSKYSYKSFSGVGFETQCCFCGLTLRSDSCRKMFMHTEGININSESSSHGGNICYILIQTLTFFLVCSLVN